MKKRTWADVLTSRRRADEEFFLANKETLAFSTNSLTWPSYWRAVVFKIDRIHSMGSDTTAYVVYPRNPEYDEYEEKMFDAWLGGKQTPVEFSEAPPLHLPPATFASLEEIDTWAKTVARMTRKPKKEAK